MRSQLQLGSKINSLEKTMENYGQFKRLYDMMINNLNFMNQLEQTEEQEDQQHYLSYLDSGTR